MVYNTPTTQEIVRQDRQYKNFSFAEDSHQELTQTDR